MGQNNAYIQSPISVDYQLAESKNVKPGDTEGQLYTYLLKNTHVEVDLRSQISGCSRVNCVHALAHLIVMTIICGIILIPIHR